MTSKEARRAPDAPVAPEVDRQVQEYLRKPYTMVVRGEPIEGYLGKVLELPGCITAGETPEEATEMLRDAMYSWLLAAVEHRRPIPEPGSSAEQYSGRFVLRVPKHLHRELAELAERDGVSLNTFAVALLERGVGAVLGVPLQAPQQPEPVRQEMLGEPIRVIEAGPVGPVISVGATGGAFYGTAGAGVGIGSAVILSPENLDEIAERLARHLEERTGNRSW